MVGTGFKHYGLKTSREVLLTSEQGDRVSPHENVIFELGEPTGNVISVDPEKLRQSLFGIGTSFTESSAFVLAHLDPARRHEVMANIFSSEGANFSLARTPIGSCDFCVEGRFSYDDVADDVSLGRFDIGPDSDGFSRAVYPGIQSEDYDLLPMIKEALAIKNRQQDGDLRMIASAWTAPAWMKDIEDWYQHGTGGTLKPQYENAYARYLVKYLDAYKAQGIDIWGITPVNEPLGNSGQWESMHFTPDSQNRFIKQNLGPELERGGHSAVNLLVYDHSRDRLEEWADAIMGDAETAGYVRGAAVHWYESSFKVYEEVFERVHQKYPDQWIIHTEGCIDDLGNDAPPGILDPEGFKESGWFDNDDFWWNENATDWGYTAPWPGVIMDDHPKYAPVHRYARNIIVSLNHWLSGWVDWNIVLDKRGGPNHVGNHCGAPVMIDCDSGYVYYTPVFSVLAQLSRTIRPGDRVVYTETFLDEETGGQLYACSTIGDDRVLNVQVLNTSKSPANFSLQIGLQYAPVSMAANALATFRVQLPEV